MWAALVLIILLTAMSVYGAFIGADRAKMFFNSIPSVVFWVLLALALIAGLVAFRRLIRVPGLLLMHAGCILILIGGALGSERGYRVTECIGATWARAKQALGWERGYKIGGNDKIIEGYMKLFEDQSSRQVTIEKKIPLFDISLDFAKSLDASSIPQSLRQEFEKEQAALSQAAGVFVNQPGGIWFVADENGQYYVRREGGKLKVYDFIQEMKELPFEVKLIDFRIEYYEPSYLLIGTPDGRSLKVPAEIGEQIDLGGELGIAKITRKFEYFRMSLEDGKMTAFEDPHGNPMPALEVRITPPVGEVTTRYAFTFEFGHTQGGPKLIYNKPAGGPISDFISELEITDQDGRVLAKKDIEVNHPLQYGGYRFYQSGYDEKAGRYTVLQVVSDTGVTIVFAGYWMLCIGAFWHLWLRHFVSRISYLVSRRGKKQTDGNSI